MSAAGRCIAMWSGPRNLSTAMMRAWENRTDTTVLDEPFYAHYLHATGIKHPMAEAVIASGELDWQRIIERLTRAPAEGLFYQKHITTHWMPYFTTDWLDALDHVFLIRDPYPVVASYANKRESLTAADLGYAEQAMLFETIAERAGLPPPVIDSRTFLGDPEGQLRALCTRLGVDFDPDMLHWPAGPRESDGVWSEHWYDAVRRSTGFAAPHSSTPTVALDSEQQAIVDQCLPYYLTLCPHAIETNQHSPSV